MKISHTKVGLMLTIPYVLLVLAAFLYTVIMQNYYPEKSEFSGVYITVLTFPWSLLASLILILLAIAGVDFSLGVKVIIIIGAILNTIILYKIGQKIEQPSDRKGNLDK